MKKLSAVLPLAALIPLSVLGQNSAAISEQGFLVFGGALAKAEV
jgi:hypothetical protein